MNSERKTIQQWYRVDRREIFYIQAIFDGYDGIASITTIDPEKGIIRISIPPDSEAVVSAILADLKTSGCMIEPVEP